VVAACALAVAAPWYWLCYARNGWPFIDEFFLKHHFSRFSSEALQHVRPFWFYGPVLLGGVFPWTPALALLPANIYKMTATRFLAAWFLFGFIFFSLSTNKLPGYLLPLLPAVYALIAVAASEGRAAHLAVGLTGLLLGTVPALIGLLPAALQSGLSNTNWTKPVAQCLPVMFGLWGLLEHWPVRRAAIVAAFLAVAAVGILKYTTLPELDRTVSARSAWRDVFHSASDICLKEPHRNLRYGLNYYAGRALPDCGVLPEREP
jgi:4-amino-4-deoxy-L-arabinose transferase-like glycosyltransferase